MVKPAQGHLDSSPGSNEGSPANQPLAAWESTLCDAVGNVIEFWGFKRNQGRVWALLYLRNSPLSATDLRELLGLSKGAVSMVTRELEQWGVISRVRWPGEAGWRFRAGTDLLPMINRVLESRELAFIERVRVDLLAAEAGARADDGVSPEVLERVARMRRLAEMVESALRVFVRTAKFDVSPLMGALGSTVRRATGRQRSSSRSSNEPHSP